MDQKAFDEIIAQFQFTVATVEQLRSVLVNGEVASAVAARHAISRQTLSQKVRKVKLEWAHRQQLLAARTIGSDLTARSDFLKDKFENA